MSRLMKIAGWRGCVSQVNLAVFLAMFGLSVRFLLGQGRAG
jgi:hypothetical protein